MFILVIIDRKITILSKKTTKQTTQKWVEGDLRLVGLLDTRMIGLLKAIAESGSINQAAKLVGLSYKGAWQIIEKANNMAPKVLISTATGGAKGGGTSLTTAGQALLELFNRVDTEHKVFLQKINQKLADDPVAQLLLKRLIIKTSATNQLFGSITAIEIGAVNAQVVVKLKGGEQVVAAISLTDLTQLNLVVDGDVILLINDPEIIMMTDPESYQYSSRNCLAGKVMRIQTDGIDAEVVIQLSSGDSIVAMITQASAENMNLKLDTPVYALFKSNSVILGTH